MTRLGAYARLARLNRPIGNFLLLWPMLWALWIAAEGLPDLKVLLVFLLGVLVMRAAGCVINDFADRRIDGHVKRTRHRPLATGEVSAREALVLFVVLCLLAFGLVSLMNPLTIQLSFVGVLLAASYPFMKRYTHFPQVHLGAAFGWAVPMAYAAQTGELAPVAWLVFIAAVIWATVYDTQYAMVDRDDDLKIGVKSTAVLFGEQDRLIVGLLMGLMLLALLLVGQRAGLGWVYFLSLLPAAALFVYQQWLMRERRREECFRAFLNNNWFGGVIFLGIVLDYLLV
ncbi:4-hydroxybenzoate octaprenyltransferase [Alkalilimnicola sp. S0819]|uniref:4-hydroxybenzoate octaprenyltransferase n=1 Tax=Alkalilimnicola sp. S0819 TaxID=2613922 RepID=UPI0012623A33|nr:4-hydroxybenzoate octaprenyltransferase [Alkalilimnicola sp. S0819]KAB7624488.1 4-hydroxybenzoate octaprenyltransferase [Alkalilimnicola sp. S0819]MPQ16259.1 4-hydroxybenzoate octaprenyltransferase [Alkalilimnicola sp. S0819]